MTNQEKGVILEGKKEHALPQAFRFLVNLGQDRTNSVIWLLLLHTFKPRLPNFQIIVQSSKLPKYDENKENIGQELDQVP